MAITFSGLAQQMPYNPDANGDDFVGVDDVLGVLGVYDTALMQPDLQCDYEGTELEEFTGGHFAGDLILDSVYVEYLFVDSVETFLSKKRFQMGRLTLKRTSKFSGSKSGSSHLKRLSW